MLCFGKCILGDRTWTKSKKIGVNFPAVAPFTVRTGYIQTVCKYAVNVVILEAFPEKRIDTYEYVRIQSDELNQ